MGLIVAAPSGPAPWSGAWPAVCWQPCRSLPTRGPSALPNAAMARSGAGSADWSTRPSAEPPSTATLRWGHLVAWRLAGRARAQLLRSRCQPTAWRRFVVGRAQAGLLLLVLCDMRTRAARAVPQAMLSSAGRLVHARWRDGWVRDVYADFNALTLEITIEALFGGGRGSSSQALASAEITGAEGMAAGYALVLGCSRLRGSRGEALSGAA